MHRALRWAAALSVALLMVPAGQAQINNPDDSTPTTMYMHIFDTFNKFVVNVQPMDTQFFEVGGTSFPSLAGTPINDGLARQFDFNTIYGTSTAGPVEYDFIENGKPRFHPERGIAADVVLDANVQPMAYVYIQLRDLVGSSNPDEWGAMSPVILPDFTVRLTMRTGDDPGEDADYDAGDLIMSGQTTLTPYTGGSLAAINGGLDALGAVTEGIGAGALVAPGPDGVIEFAIPLEVANPRIPKSEAFNIRLDWYQGDDLQEDAFAAGYMRLYAAEGKQPRIELATLNPVFIEFIHPQVAAGTLLIHTGVNSPWGTYDLDPSNITMTVEGPSTPANLQQVVAQNQHVHGLHDQAAEITYLWKFRDEGAAEGDYTIRMEVPNGAGTAVATGTAGFTIAGQKAFGVSDTGQVVEPTVAEETNDSPGVGLIAMLGLLGAALVIGRRRA